MPTDPISVPPLTPTQKLAITLSLPAFIAATPLLLILPNNDNSMFFAALPFVVLIWYGVGRWFDRMLGFIPRGPQKARSWMGAALLLTVAALLIGIGILTPLYHHRDTNSRWIGTGFVAWATLSLAMIFSGSHPRSEQGQ